MNIIDLSHTLSLDMPMYPGTKQPVLNEIKSHASNGYMEHSLTLSSHTGTHIDAPAHMIKNGKTLDQFSVDHFVGSAYMLEIKQNDQMDIQIKIDDLADQEEQISAHDFLIINTGWHRKWGSEQYFTNYPTLAPETASWLSDFGLKGIGTDTISVDAPGVREFVIHKILLEKKIIIIENLANVNSVNSNSFIFSCLPLKFKNSDGSPTRAMAFNI